MSDPLKLQLQVVESPDMSAGKQTGPLQEPSLHAPVLWSRMSSV